MRRRKDQRRFVAQASVSRRRIAEEAVRLVSENRALDSWAAEAEAIFGSADISAADAMRMYRAQQRAAEQERRAKKRRHAAAAAAVYGGGGQQQQQQQKTSDIALSNRLALPQVPTTTSSSGPLTPRPPATAALPVVRSIGGALTSRGGNMVPHLSRRSAGPISTRTRDPAP